MSKKEENFLKKKNLNENDLKNVSGGKYYIPGVRKDFSTYGEAEKYAADNDIYNEEIEYGNNPLLEPQPRIYPGNPTDD